MFRAGSPAETQRLARCLGELCQAGDLIGLHGDLGAGKTLFAQGLAAGLGVDPARVASPTFTLINEHRGGRLSFYHVDLYRLEHARELEELGLAELFDAGGVVAIEWLDRFPELAPAEWLEVRFRIIAAEERAIEPRGVGARGLALAQAWAQACEAAHARR
jgi:tRNA threonylcarbamoyladenosine biosynthesis protein TsaE